MVAGLTDHYSDGQSHYVEAELRHLLTLGIRSAYCVLAGMLALGCDNGAGERLRANLRLTTCERTLGRVNEARLAGLWKYQGGQNGVGHGSPQTLTRNERYSQC
jgi:hypothetical protein